MRAAWDWRIAPFLASLEQGRAPAELTTEVVGSFDAFEASGSFTDIVSSGDKVFALGWALADHATPFQVAVLVDGRRTFSTRDIFTRPDVVSTLREPSPSGWRIAIDTEGLAPGDHQVTAMAWASEKGEGHYLATRVLTVRAANLDAAARTAAARIRDHQYPDGYWLTAHTPSVRFEAPSSELNTFLTAFMVDILSELERDGYLAETSKRARQYLTKQIEANGLVRYHGRPDAPGIGTLGCVITPDTDDTALVWRIAPSGDIEKRATALAIINHYRAPGGLYRTWLAPREDYQCLDPGRDPNPTDLAVQIHLLQLLDEVQQAKARELCEVLKQMIDQDRIWVYYQKTPLIPMLRLASLQRIGCELTLPASRTRTSSPEQDLWASVVRHLVPKLRAQDDQKAADVLRQLAKDDFAMLRNTPPLLYHNDLSATVARYYWSEDIGYALWLRLYVLTYN